MKFKGRAHKFGNNVNTDEIIPARHLATTDAKELANHGMEDIDTDFAGRVRKGDVIVAGKNFGCGSSREHAAICPMVLGVKAVIAKSFERIHAANLINFGILPLTFGKADDYQHLEAGDVVELPDVRKKITRGEKPVLKNKTRDTEIELNYDLTEKEVKLILAGGLLNYMRG